MQLLDAAMGGFNVTVLVYGQTGSGKTFTMSGREEVIDGDGYVGDPGPPPDLPLGSRPQQQHTCWRNS